MKKERDLEQRIKDCFRKGPMAAWYIAVCVNFMHENLKNMDDETVFNLFIGMESPHHIRNNIRILNNIIHDNNEK